MIRSFGRDTILDNHVVHVYQVLFFAHGPKRDQNMDVRQIAPGDLMTDRQADSAAISFHVPIISRR